MRPSRAGVLLACGVAAVLAGCSAGLAELQAWTEQQRREAKPRSQPLLPPRRFDPEPYQLRDQTDPFDPQKLSIALRQETRQVSAAIAQELNRRREPLEAYSLGDIRMVGSLNRQGTRMALITADRLLYQVKVGDYLGQNFGRILRIEESRIDLRELVQDATGEWVERPASLELQERTR